MLLKPPASGARPIDDDYLRLTESYRIRIAEAEAVQDELRRIERVDGGGRRVWFFDGPEENRVVLRINTPANYLQLYEGGCDSAHVGILHMNMMNPGWKDSAFVGGASESPSPSPLAPASNPLIDHGDGAELAVGISSGRSPGPLPSP